MSSDLVHIGGEDVFFDEENKSSTEFLNHTTKDGVTMLVSDMDDSHLKHTINLFIKHLTDVKSQLVSDHSSFLSGVYRKEMDKETLQDRAHFLFVTLHKYIFEAALRRLDIDTEITRLRQVLEYDLSIN